jgi:hypothetical protein
MNKKKTPFRRFKTVKKLREAKRQEHEALAVVHLIPER